MEPRLATKLESTLIMKFYLEPGVMAGVILLWSIVQESGHHDWDALSHRSRGPHRDDQEQGKAQAAICRSICKSISSVSASMKFIIKFISHAIPSV